VPKPERAGAGVKPFEGSSCFVPKPGEADVVAIGLELIMLSGSETGEKGREDDDPSELFALGCVSEVNPLLEVANGLVSVEVGAFTSLDDNPPEGGACVGILFATDTDGAGVVVEDSDGGDTLLSKSS